MSLLKELQNKSTDKANQRQAVADEIVEWFTERINSSQFEKNLQERIEDSSSAIRDRRYPVDIEFWDHSSGCSETHFRVVGAGYWVTGGGYGEHYYKGIRVSEIQQEIGQRLLNLTLTRLKELGFGCYVKDHESWLGFYHKQIIISW